MRKIFIRLLITLLTVSCMPALADGDSGGSSDGGGGGGGGSGVGIAIGAAAVIGLLIWAFSDSKDDSAQVPAVTDPMASQTPVSIETESSEGIKQSPSVPAGGVGNVKSMEF